MNRSAAAAGAAIIAVGLLLCPVARAAEDFADPADITRALQARLQKLRDRLPAFKESIDLLKQRGQDVAYPVVSLTVLDNFDDLVEEDFLHAVPDGWGFIAVNGAQAGFEMDTHNPHSPPHAVRFWNKTPAHPNVYGMMESNHGITLKEGQPYTLSAWVRSENPGRASLVAGGAWHLRLEIPPTGGQWKQVHMTFHPGPADLSFSPRIITEDVTEGFWVDDVRLVEGSEPDETATNLVHNPTFAPLWTLNRAAMMLDEMEDIAARLDVQLEKALAGEKLPEVPRWTGKQRPIIEGPSLVAPVHYPTRDDPPRMRPIFLIGYGHFSKARLDIPLFPNYGINIIQGGEWGPSAIYPAEGKFDDAMITQTLAALDAGREHGVAYDLLISPHYFPGWVIEKHPHLRKVRYDFFPYSLFADEGRAFLKQFIAEVLPRFRDQPALMSICLSNEPINAEEPSDSSRAAWHAWLREKHGDVATINRRWGTEYRSIDEIHQPNVIGHTSERRPSPIWYDFLRFNQQWFAGFHQELADAVRAALPDVPIHTKATTWHFWRAHPHNLGGLEPTQFADFSDIHGNDSVNIYGYGRSAPAQAPPERGDQEFAQGWIENALGYTLQRSTKDAPVFNSENHIVLDRDMRPFPPEHVRALLWQGALHGQSLTTMWVWERTFNPRHDFAGNIMDRPASAEAAGIVCHDLNRVAPEMSALQKLPPRVAILHSPTASIWDGHDYEQSLLRLFTALSFTGLKIGFQTEVQLERGIVTDAPILFVPHVVHLSDAARKSLEKYNGRLVLVGPEQLLTRSEYDNPRDPPQAQARLKPDATTTRQELWQMILPQLEQAGIHPPLQVVAADAKPQWGVQWLCAQADAGLVVNLYNARIQSMDVILQSNPAGTLTDLLTGAQARTGDVITLEPMEVRLYRLSTTEK